MAQAQTKDIPEPCVALLPAFSRYIDKEASPEEIRTIQEHTSKCPICNANLESMTEASVTYRSLVPFLPLATFKVWGSAKTAILAGKGAAAAAQAAETAAGGGASSAGTAAASATTASTAAATSAGTAATTAGVATGVAAAGMALSTKILIVVGAIILAAGLGTGGYFGYEVITRNPVAGITLVEPTPGSSRTVLIDKDEEGVLILTLGNIKADMKDRIKVIANGEELKQTAVGGTKYELHVRQDGKFGINVQPREDSGKNRLLGSITVNVKQRARYIAFIRSNELWTADLDKNFAVVPGTEKMITTNDWPEGCPAFSPNGSTIGYLRGETVQGLVGYYQQVYTIPRGGGTPQVLVKSKRMEGDPSRYVSYSSLSWTGDGSGVICNSEAGPSYATNMIYKISVPSGSEEELSATTTGDVAIAPDGSRAETIPLHAPSGHDPTLSITVDGKSRVIFTVDEGRFSFPVWAPDSSFFSVYNGSVQEMWHIDRQGSVIKRFRAPMSGKMCSDLDHYVGEENGTVYVWSEDNPTPRPVLTTDSKFAYPDICIVEMD